jgi:hypothetical protein
MNSLDWIIIIAFVLKLEQGGDQPLVSFALKAIMYRRH